MHLSQLSCPFVVVPIEQAVLSLGLDNVVCQKAELFIYVKTKR